MVERKEYLDQLWAWKDEQQIKVVTGIRRCGKSVLLEQYQQRLLANGVTPEQIISINFENLDYEPLKDYMKLYNYLKERLCADKMTYIFLDEVQEVPSFEKVVDSLYIRNHVDVYITGSNAYMLSSELATLLSGRYTEIKMLPFSFLSLNVKNLFRNFYFRLFIRRKHNIQNDCKQCCRHDSRATENQCDRLRKMCKYCGICTKSITKSKCNRNDSYVSRSYRPLGDQLDTADYNG